MLYQFGDEKLSKQAMIVKILVDETNQVVRNANGIKSQIFDLVHQKVYPFQGPGLLEDSSTCQNNNIVSQ